MNERHPEQFEDNPKLQSQHRTPLPRAMMPFRELKVSINILLYVGVLLAAIGVAYMLLPSALERADSLIKDKKYHQALTLLNAAYKQGAQDPVLHLRLAGLLSHYGQMEAFEDVVKHAIAIKKDNVILRDKLLTYYQFSSREDDYFALLEDSATHTGQAKYYRTLLHNLQLRGDYVKEEAILSAMSNHPNFGQRDLRRLFLLLAKKGENDAAIAMVKKHDQGGNDAPELWDMYHHAFSLLLRRGDSEEALARSARWLASAGNHKEVQAAVTRMSHALVQTGRADLLERFAGQVANSHASLKLAVSQALIAMGLIDRARSYLFAVKDVDHDFTKTEVAMMVHGLVQLGEIDVATSFLLARDSRQIAQIHWVDLSIQAYAKGRDDLLFLFEPNVTQQTRQLLPLLDVQFLAVNGEDAKAKRILQSFNLKQADLSEQEAWLLLAKDLLAPNQVAAKFKDINNSLALSPDSLRSYANLFKKIDRQEYNRVWALLGGQYPVRSPQDDGVYGSQVLQRPTGGRLSGPNEVLF